MQTKNLIKMFVMMLLAVTAFICCTCTAMAADSWTTKAGMPTARYYLPAAEVNGKIYAIGGWNGSSYFNMNEMYDSATNTWTAKAPMPTARYATGAAVVNGKIYVIGGTNGNTLNKVEVYDPQTNTWTSKTGMPTARYDLSVVAVNGKIYAIGGYNGAYLNKVEMYDPEKDTWTTKASMPTARDYAGAAAANGKIYVIGGYNGSGCLDKVEEYDPTTNNWTVKANMPTARNALGTETIAGEIYAVGGYNGGSLGNIEKYNPSTNTWTKKYSSMIARHGFGTAVAENKMYVIGGYTTGIVNTVQEYDPSEDNWVPKVSMPTARCGAGVVKANSKIYVIGGTTNANQGINKVEEYDPATNTWTAKANMPTGRRGIAAAVVKGKIYAIGGADANIAFNKVEEYDPVTNTWTVKANMPTARWWAGATVFNDKIYVIGGYNGGYLNKVEEYDPATNTWTEKTGMPTARYEIETEILNDKIYVMGGTISNGVYTNVVEMYDPQEDTWTTKAPMFMAKSAIGMVNFNGRIYAVGGYNGSCFNAFEEYDPLSDTWTKRGSMPTARGYTGAVEANGILYAIGGYTTDGINTVEAYVFPPVTSPTPTGLQAVLDGSKMAVTWSPVSGVTGYDIEVDGVVIDNGASTAYTHNSLTSGSQHIYRVRSRNAFGTGEWSAPVMKFLAPDTLQGLMVSPSRTSVTLAWEAVAGATGYDIEADGMVVNGTTATTYEHTGLTPGTLHTYRVRAVTGEAQSPWTTAVKMYTLPEEPGIPSNITAVPGITQVTLAWNPVQGATSYDVDADGMVSSNGTSTNFIHIDLAGGTPHTYKVRTTGPLGKSDWSTPITVTTLPATNGLKGEYYNNMDFTDLKLIRTDAAVDFDWGAGSPYPSMETDTFAVRWTGQVEAPYTGEYTFYTYTDDGVRLWVNGQLLVDRCVDQCTENSGTITLEAGQKYDIKLEYYDNQYGATARLLWSYPDQVQQVIPYNCLYPTYSGTYQTIQNGLKGEYFDNADFTAPILTRTDNTVNFDWGEGTPDTSMGADTFAIRWTGKVEAKYSETYTFCTDTDDGVRLWVNGQLLINNWTDQCGENSATIDLAAGQKYDIKLEYYDNQYGAKAKLMWSSPSQPKEVIPRYCLYVN